MEMIRNLWMFWVGSFYCGVIHDLWNWRWKWNYQKYSKIKLGEHRRVVWYLPALLEKRCVYTKIRTNANMKLRLDHSGGVSRHCLTNCTPLKVPQGEREKFSTVHPRSEVGCFDATSFFQFVVVWGAQLLTGWRVWGRSIVLSMMWKRMFV